MLPEKAAKSFPSFARTDVHDQKIVRTVAEIADHFGVVVKVPPEVGALVSNRSANAVNPT